MLKFHEFVLHDSRFYDYTYKYSVRQMLFWISFQIRVDGCTGKLSFSKMGVRNETYLQLKSLATNKNGTVCISVENSR